MFIDVTVIWNNDFRTEKKKIKSGIERKHSVPRKPEIESQCNRQSSVNYYVKSQRSRKKETKRKGRHRKTHTHRQIDRQTDRKEREREF